MRVENNKYWDDISKYTSGEMSREEKEIFENLMKEAGDFELLNKVNEDLEKVNAVKEMYSDKVNKGWDNLYNRLNKENLIPHTEPKVRKLSNSILFKVAAAVLLIVGVTISGLYLFTKSGQNGMNYAQTEYNQKTVYLADGSVVKLNGNSKLVYPDVFNETSREVELVGEAFFDIAKNPEKPFIIKANNAEIKVLGTSFNVLAFKETELVEVFVKSGKVSVTPLENGNKSIVLQKGDFGKVQNKKASKDVLSDPNYMSWHSRKLYFVETPIKEVVEILNRSYACNIAINDTSINNYNFNSTYDNASLNTILESICTSYNIEKIEDNHRIILQNRHK